MTTDTSEKAFQNDIIANLVSTGYKKRGKENYNKALCKGFLGIAKRMNKLGSKKNLSHEKFAGIVPPRTKVRGLDRDASNQ